ncbi:hypothetical protein ACS0TY_009082 [Phlomoides rotata]
MVPIKIDDSDEEHEVESPGIDGRKMPRKRLFHEAEKSSTSVLKSEESRTSKGKAPIVKLEFGRHKYPRVMLFPIEKVVHAPLLVGAYDIYISMLVVSCYSLGLGFSLIATTKLSF